MQKIFSRPLPAARWLIGLGLSLAALQAAGLDIALPQDNVRFAPSDLPGFKLVEQNCLVCHSAHYVLYQPTASGRDYWDTIVRKMQHPFGALFTDAEIAPMVDYLVKTYGAEQRPWPVTGRRE